MASASNTGITLTSARSGRHQSPHSNKIPLQRHFFISLSCPGTRLTVSASLAITIMIHLPHFSMT